MIAVPLCDDLRQSYTSAVVRGCVLRLDRFTPFRLARMPAWLVGSLRADAFARDALGGARRFPNRFELLSSSVASAPPSGLVLEFGVFEGDSISWIAKCAQNRPDPAVYGFDSFQGLPEDWSPGYRRGAFRIDGTPSVPPNVILVKGMFQSTLGPFLDSQREPVALVHIDSDLYSSARFVLETLHQYNRLRETTVLVFDELVGAPNWWRGGEFRALQDFVTPRSLSIVFLGHAVASGSVAVCLRPTGPDSTTVRMPGRE